MIYSRSAMARQEDAETAVCVEMYDGEPLSYMSRLAVERYAELARRGPVVPVTTRTPEQYRRVHLPGPPPAFAVASNGGRILVDGTNDDAWSRTVRTAIAETSAPLAEVHAHLTSLADDWVTRIRIADTMFCYLVVDPDHQPAGFLPAFDDWCRERGWSASQQGRKLYAMPTGVTKSAAVAEVRRRLVASGVVDHDAPVLAAGDGWLDRDLLSSATAAIRPAHGELADRNWRTAHLAVTSSCGIAAGEEILAWFATKARASERTGRAAWNADRDTGSDN